MPRASMRNRIIFCDLSVDTNVCVQYLNGGEESEMDTAADVDDIAACSIVKAELFYAQQ